MEYPVSLQIIGSSVRSTMVKIRQDGKEVDIELKKQTRLQVLPSDIISMNDKIVGMFEATEAEKLSYTTAEYAKLKAKLDESDSEVLANEIHGLVLACKELKDKNDLLQKELDKALSEIERLKSVNTTTPKKGNKVIKAKDEDGNGIPDIVENEDF